MVIPSTSGETEHNRALAAGTIVGDRAVKGSGTGGPEIRWPAVSTIGTSEPRGAVIGRKEAAG